ncbi:hypothetical protein VF21_09173 [Pseudogymnoascus sp. 05NY08]|nr:hypothetical protein VF21_09173 [Pseudogymnoascus sp. 05NY08]
MAQPLISSPEFEHHPDGLGVGHSRPRISWHFSHPKGNAAHNWVQSAYDTDIRMDNLAESKIWHVESSNSVLVPWPAADLSSRSVAAVRIRSYNQDGIATEWSPWSTVEAALFRKEDWAARPITSAQRILTKKGGLRPIRFRKQFSVAVEDKIVKARLYITALGVYEAYLNGMRIGDHILAPGWTSYLHRLNYQIFDVTAQILTGENVLAVEVAEGWYAGRLGWGGGKRFIYGDDLGVLAQLEITSNTGHVMFVKSDKTWQSLPSAITCSEFYDGEVYDNREETVDWNTLSYDTGSCMGVKELSFPSAKLVSPDAPPVRVTQKIEPINIITSPAGKTIIDFGQNLAGVVQIRSLQASQGHQISLVHVEVLEDGEISTRPLRDAECTDIVICSSETLNFWKPRFTFHGFRYVEVNNWPGVPTKDDFSALVIHSDMQRRGWFSCSNPLVNKLHENTVWGMRGNFVSIPSDCPQRDERLGWTGDVQIFTPSANFLYNSVGMLAGWMEDVMAEQLARTDGVPGLVVPDVLPDLGPIRPHAVWNDVVILTPWDLYLYSSDTELLRRQYPSMKIYLDKAIPRDTDGLWDPNFWQLGDWLDPKAPLEEPGDGRTDGVLVADAYLVHITQTLSKVCDVIGLSAESESYRLDSLRLKAAFQHKYITPHGMLVNNTQTAVSLAVRFDLYPKDKLTVAGKGIARLVRDSKFRIATGFAGTPVICHSLTAMEHTNLAYRMLLEQHCPSWLYPVTMGATTIWERWDSILPDWKVNPGSMTSFNHYALGSVVDWLHGTVGGISSVDGWKTVIVKPIPGGDIFDAQVAFEGPYGRVSCRWSVSSHNFTMELVIPPNSTAIVKLPYAGSQQTVVGSGNHEFSCHYIAEEWPPKRETSVFWASTKCDCFEDI